MDTKDGLKLLREKKKTRKREKVFSFQHYSPPTVNQALVLPTKSVLFPKKVATWDGQHCPLYWSCTLRRGITTRFPFDSKNSKKRDLYQSPVGLVPARNRFGCLLGDGLLPFLMYLVYSRVCYIPASCSYL
jgi:hypothetical protein